MSDVQHAAPFSRWEWMLAGRYLRAKKSEGGIALIAVISFVFIALAVALLIISMAIFNGFRAELLDRMLSFNGHIFVQGEALWANRTNEAVARLRDAPGVARVIPQIFAESIVSARGSATGVMVRGVSAADLRSIPIIKGNIRAGSLNGFGEGEYGGELVVIGSRMAEKLGIGPGDGITIFSINGTPTAFGAMPTSKTYTVGAIFEVGQSQYDSAFVYMPLQQAQLLFGKGGDVDVIEVTAKDPDNIDAVLPGVRQAAGKGSVVTDWRESNASFWGALQVERNMVRLMLCLLVFFASTTIISGVVMLVKNKERNIAVLRTMGASRGSIMRVFIIAGAALGVFAVPVGVGLGALFCTYVEPIQAALERITGTSVFDASVYFLPHVPARIDWSEVGWVCAFTFILSVVMTLIPSWLASRIDPVEALRYE